MSTTIELDGVSTWYDEQGAGEPLVYLHGGFSDASELEPVGNRYAEHFRVLAPERRGHGHTPDSPGPFDFGLFAADTIAFIESVIGGPVHLVGFSDGATTGLHVALQRPDLVRRLVMISGQFHHDGLLPAMFGDDPVAAAQSMTETPLAARYAEVSPDGAGHFSVVAEKVVRMAMSEPQLTLNDLQGVESRTLVMCSDDDAVSLEHSVALYRGLPDAEFAVIPGTSHALIMEKPDRAADLVLDFLTQDPIETLVPLARHPN